VVRWHRKGFKLYWRWISKRGPGRPPISLEVRKLIKEFALDNGWGARKIHAELGKLGFTVSLATVSRYRPKQPRDKGKQQRWMMFLRNHRDGIAAMDFFVVPTITFRLLYVWFVIDHVIVFSEDHLRRLLRDYVRYYNTDRVHTSIKDAPEGRLAEARLSSGAKVVGFPRVGGLHHRYAWQEAA
jgi:transposase InsO family protein